MDATQSEQKCSMILLTYKSQNQSSNDSLKTKQCKDIDHISLLETFAKAENLFKKYVRLAKKHKIPISDKIELYPKITSAKSYYGECLDRSDHIEIRISEIAFEVSSVLAFKSLPAIISCSFEDFNCITIFCSFSEN